MPFPNLSQQDHVVQKQLNEALSSFQATLQRPVVTDPELAEAYGTLGKFYHAYQLADAAGACYRNARLLAPWDFRWLYYLGRVYQREGNKASEAAASFQAALQIRPDDLAAQLRLAEVLQAQNDWESAERIYADVLAKQDDSAAALAGLGKCAAARRDFSKAAEYYEAALRIQSDASGLHYPLAMAYRQLGDRQKAEDHLAKRGMWPTFPDPLMDDVWDLGTGKKYWFLRAINAYGEGNLKKAAAEYRAMIEAHPDDPVARIELGSILAQMGEREPAMEQLTWALELSPGNATALYNLGLLHSQAGSSQQAIRHYETALQADPEFKRAHFQLANELMRTRQFDKALSHYVTVVNLDPGNGFTRLMEAMALVGSRRYTEAQAALEDSHRALPDDPDITTALARLLAASPDRSSRDGQRALALLQGVFQAHKSMELEQIEALAMALAETGRLENAVEVQQMIVSKAEQAGQPELARILGENLTLYRQGKPCRLPWRDDDPTFKPVPGTLGAMSSAAGQRMGPEPGM